jgi:crotonobetainyl-CoA:carnitine CoA-transferase CaiB-like acyl-CoA transferase
MSGLMSITGPVEGEPHRVGVAVTDLVTGIYSTTAILAALHERQPPGGGRIST